MGDGKVDVLIFDDDSQVTGMLAMMLGELGCRVQVFFNGVGAIDHIRQASPRVIVVDIMMPGMDGLAICKSVKTDPEIRDVKVLILSGRDYKQDEEDALRCGADAFCGKGGNAQRLFTRLQELLKAAPLSSRAHVRPAPVLRVAVWGSRGPLDGTGGSLLTCCVSMEFGNRLVILDAGTGLRNLCSAGMPAAMSKDIFLLLTHYHADHVAGLKELSWAQDPACTLNFLGPMDPDNQLAGAVQKGLAATGSPKARVQAAVLTEARFPLWSDAFLEAMFVKHPGNTLAYRIEYAGKRIVYCPDNEIESDEDVESDYNEKFGRFIRGCDLLIHDARYLDEDYERQKGKGHGCPRLIVGFAQREGVRTLALFHQDGNISADQLDSVLRQTRDSVSGNSSPMAVELAQEGSVYLI